MSDPWQLQFPHLEDGAAKSVSLLQGHWQGHWLQLISVLMELHLPTHWTSISDISLPRKWVKYHGLQGDHQESSAFLTSHQLVCPGWFCGFSQWNVSLSTEDPLAASSSAQRLLFSQNRGLWDTHGDSHRLPCQLGTLEPHSISLIPSDSICVCVLVTQ